MNIFKVQNLKEKILTGVLLTVGIGTLAAMVYGKNVSERNALELVQVTYPRYSDSIEIEHVFPEFKEPVKKEATGINYIVAEYCPYSIDDCGNFIIFEQNLDTLEERPDLEYIREGDRAYRIVDLHGNTIIYRNYNNPLPCVGAWC
jgi:hypothetical protein